MSESDVFDEIKSDIQREKLQQFWKENGSWIIGGAIGAILLTAALSGWRYWDHDRDMEATAELYKLTLAAENLPGLAEFGKTATGKNQAIVALLTAAGAYVDQGKKDEAIALYGEAAKLPGVENAYRDLAKILSVSLRLGRDDPENLKKELAPLVADKAAWRYMALEMQALLDGKQKRFKDAVAKLEQITADPLVPEGIRTRALTLRALYLADIEPESKN
jgi:hypothetical protein